MNRSTVWILFVGALVACARPAVPPDPPILSQAKCDDPAGPLPLREIEVEHIGCPGPCPQYRVRVTADGGFEYEGKKFVRDMGRRHAQGHASDVSPLFAWICEHPALYAKSGGDQRGADTEELIYRFRLNDGQVVEVHSDIGFEHDDLWVLSTLVDGVIGRALMVTWGKEDRQGP